MNPLGEAWLLNRAGNCIEVHAHPSESFEFESIVRLISEYGSESDKANCKIWRTSHSSANPCRMSFVEAVSSSCKIS